MALKKPVLKQKQRQGQNHSGNFQIRMMHKNGLKMEEFYYEKSRVLSKLVP